VLTYLQEMNAGGLAKIILANSPPPREWGVGAHAATQGAVETAVAARVAATVQAYRAASAAAAAVTAMDEGCDTSAPEWHWCYPVQVQALVDAGVATATADTPFYEDQQLGAAGPESSRGASSWRAPRDRWSEAAWVLRRHWDRHLTEEALVNAPEGTAYTPAPDGQDKHRCAHYPQCREQGEIPLTAAISVRSNEGKTTTLWGAEASSKARNSPRIALCCGWQMAITGCKGRGAPVETQDRVFQYTAGRRVAGPLEVGQTSSVKNAMPWLRGVRHPMQPPAARPWTESRSSS
jgi:hypothetical protein